jgi:rod shape-determining protein MreC
VSRTSTFRTLLVWTLLELVAALQVRSVDGIPVLFSWVRVIVEPISIAADRARELVFDFGLGVRGLERAVVENRRMRLELEEMHAREVLRQADLEALRESATIVGGNADFEAGAVIGRCAYRDLAGGMMEVRTTDRLIISRDAPVVTADGLVGRVVRSEGRRHWLQLLTHAAAAVAVQTVDGQLDGLALGSGGEGLTVAYVPRQAELKRGTLLVTSGGDGVFPPGIATVRVTRVRESDDPFLEVDAVSTADLRSIRVVLILPKWAPAEAATP